METVILGLGNELLGDEGAGVHAVRRLRYEELPGNPIIVEVGTAILDALPEFERADRIIVIDAMQDDMPPGTVYKIPLESCRTKATIASMHGFDIFRTLALAQRDIPPEVTVIGIEPKSMDWSLELSQQLRDSMVHLIAAVKEELKQHN